MLKRDKLHYSLSEIKSIESMSMDNSPVHRLSAVIKILITFVYILSVVSFNKYDFTRILLFSFYPIIIHSITNIKFSLLLKKSLISLFFVFFVCVGNLFFEDSISSGILSFFSLALKAYLSVLAVLILSASSPMVQIIQALRKLHIPCVIVLQLMLSFRYIELLINQLINIRNAYLLRSNSNRIPLRDWTKLLSCLLLKSLESASNIYNSMLCRGFNAKTVVSENIKIRKSEYLLLFAFISICLVLRFINIPQLFTKIL